MVNSSFTPTSLTTLPPTVYTKEAAGGLVIKILAPAVSVASVIFPARSVPVATEKVCSPKLFPTVQVYL